MNDKLNIVCFLWGSWFNLGKKYVINLKNSLERNIDIPFEFYCLTDISIPNINCLPIYAPSELGNLKKLAVYNPRYNFQGKVLVIDLYILVVGNITKLAQFNGDMCIRSAFWSKDKYIPDGDVFISNSNKWVDLKIWNFIERNIQKIEDITRGAERKFYWTFYSEIWDKIHFIQEKFPGFIKSYKKDNIRSTGIISKETRIISFHGHPKIHEVNHPVIKLNWE